jgi:hypothetical protein
VSPLIVVTDGFLLRDPLSVNGAEGSVHSTPLAIAFVNVDVRHYSFAVLRR